MACLSVSRSWEQNRQLQNLGSWLTEFPKLLLWAFSQNSAWDSWVSSEMAIFSNIGGTYWENG